LLVGEWSGGLERSETAVLCRRGGDHAGFDRGGTKRGAGCICRLARRERELASTCGVPVAAHYHSRLLPPLACTSTRRTGSSTYGS
jgi:hypothetical protein